MKTLHFSIVINAPKEKVWATMLDPNEYKAWTAEFYPGSYYDGSWEKGEKIKFLAPNGDGMVAVIVENKPFEFISIKHLGEIKNGIEDTESPQVKAWAPIVENYSFSGSGNVSEVKVDIEVLPYFEDDMDQAWPKALAKLKEICE